MALVKCNLNGNEVEYDDTEFKVLKDYCGMFLHYIGNGKNIHNPKGNISCHAMFRKFKGTSLDLSSFDTYNVIDMSSMFSECRNLKELNVSNFKTENVTDMFSMFAGCVNLEYLNLSNFNTKNVTNMSQMFYNNKNLRSINISKFNTAKVVNMSYMFFSCEKIRRLELSNFDMNRERFYGPKNFNNMFAHCNNLKYLDISNADLINNLIRNMFLECNKLENLKVNSKSFQYISSSNDFKWITSLGIWRNVNILFDNKIDKAIEELFY